MNPNEKLDLCLFISDQHAWERQHYAGDPLIRTPNLDRIAGEGAAFDNCYTAYPLCVPARMSMMSCQTATHCGAVTNFSALDSNRVTFAHCLDAAGYETVLCGRMHFVGPDQRHGFTRRIAGEMTPIYHNRPGSIARERGVHDRTPQGGVGCISIIGGGNSPTLEYDRYVVEQAEAYLREAHEKPQFLCVGTYGPHHPYVAPRELYEYYYDRVTVPEDSFSLPEHPVMRGMVRDTDPEVARAAMAAYYGLVEFEDQQVGRVYDAFQSYLKRTGRKGLFLYVSDHGDHAGNRGYYGKNTFYDPSVHIPLLMAGEGIPRGKHWKGAVSLMDVGPTLCQAAQAPMPPDMDGTALYDLLREGREDPNRVVVSELVGSGFGSGEFRYGMMAKWKNWKLIHYAAPRGDDLLYDLEADPQERENVLSQHPEIAERLKQRLEALCDVPLERQQETLVRLQKNLPILMACPLDSDERWLCPPCARDYPEPMTSSKLASRKKA